MDKLDKAREEICKDCMFGIALENCRACLYNLFQEMDKHSPFSGEEKDNGKNGDRNGNRNSDRRAK